MNKIFIGIVAILLLVGTAIVAVAFLGFTEGDELNSDDLTFLVSDPWYIEPTDAKKCSTGQAEIIIEIPISYTGEYAGNGYFSSFINNVPLSIGTEVSFISNDIARIKVSTVGSGEKTLTVKVIDDSQQHNVLVESSITIVIPDQWKIEYTTVGRADSGDGISRNPSSSPAWLGMNPPTHGVITRVSGEIYVDLLGNDPCNVWVDLFNKCNSQWVAPAYVIDTDYIHNGWVTIDFTFSEEVKTDWWGFAGCRSGTAAYNAVKEFRGYIYMKPGMFHCDINPLNMLIGFFAGDDHNNPPTPVKVF